MNELRRGRLLDEVGNEWLSQHTSWLSKTDIEAHLQSTSPMIGVQEAWNEQVVWLNGQDAAR